jgi:hypothetical protein
MAPRAAKLLDGGENDLLEKVIPVLEWIGHS